MIEEGKEVKLSAALIEEDVEEGKGGEEEGQKKLPLPMTRPGCPSCYGAGFFFFLYKIQIH